MDWDVVLAILAGGLGLYLLAAWTMARRYRLPDSPAERLVLELDRPGHHIALIHHEPPHRRYEDPILLCHGLASNRFNMDFVDDGTGSDRRSLARYLARAGFDTWILETRGHGHAKVPKGARFDADDQLAQDVPVAIEAVLDQTGAERLMWVGHSWGGLLQAFFQARGHHLADRVAGMVALGSPGTPNLQDRLQWVRPVARALTWSLRSRIPLRRVAQLCLPLLPLLAVLIRWWRPRQASMETGFLLRLFASLAEDIHRSWLEKSLVWADQGAFPDESNFGRIRVPMLLIAGANDLIAPPAAVAYLAERVGSSDVTFRTMGRADGCRVDYGHGGLLVAREAPDEVYPVLRAWLAARARRFRPLGGDPARSSGERADVGAGSAASKSTNGKMNGTPLIR